MNSNWQFIDAIGTFEMNDPPTSDALYFPLVNQAGMISAITPGLQGDSKTDQNHFLTMPVAVDDLHNARAGRNFWFVLEGKGAWSATGNSAAQIAQRADAPERVTLQAGFLWHKVTRESARIGLRAEIVNLVPASADHIELMQVTVTNVTDAPLTLTPIAAIPIYGRSADNLRDHRHVTSLLHRMALHPSGVLVRPTLSFDERGHHSNSVTYGVLGAEADGIAPRDFCPLAAEFVGRNGNLEMPQAIFEPTVVWYSAGRTFAGGEAMGALRFQTTTLQPGQAKTYVVILAILGDAADAARLVATYGGKTQFADWMRRTQDDWQNKLSALTFHTADANQERWLRWVTVQPILRQWIGNSFLPYHDYGRGGRGWRDLWQDCLALLMLDPERVPVLLFSYFAGVRGDGSNATIVGSAPGEFLADRNNIARIWMDHGAWPWLTTQLYLDQTGAFDFLLRAQTYFKDQHHFRSRGVDAAWSPAQGTQLKTARGDIYRGTVLEHLLVQHLTVFFNVGEHNNLKLEDADWNDGMDMASQRGESVAFTALYASNLRDLARVVRELAQRDVTDLVLAEELVLLLDTLNAPVDYASPVDKQARLRDYLERCRHTVSGKQVQIAARDLARDLDVKADWLFAHLRAQEWLTNREGFSWFNSYYDDDGARVEGDHANGVRLILTGQVFSLMGGVATDAQARELVRSVNRYLFDSRVGGVRLNTDFGEVKLNLGRCFGFAYGTKENGAMFSHMAVMYANALYRRGMVREGFRVLDTIYQHCQNFPVSHIYPGIPEYIDDQGRGAYPYLTGSASWLLLTLLTEAFGVKGQRGDLVLAPKLVREQFDAAGQAYIETWFAGRRWRITFHNAARLDYGAYQIHAVRLDGEPVALARTSDTIVLPRARLMALSTDALHALDVILN